MKKSDKKEIENMNIKISEKPTGFNVIMREIKRINWQCLPL